jgi:WD40 repeat protein
MRINFKIFAPMFLCLVFMGLPATAKDSNSRPLQFMKKIGGDDPDASLNWMSYVAFNQTGTMVVADGQPASGHSSSGMNIWSFPAGKLIKFLPFNHADLSRNWKYYADFHGVGETSTGRKLIYLGSKTYATHAFSPDSRYVAESVQHGANLPNPITITRLADGKQISAFGRHYARAIAIGPDNRTLASGYWDTVVLWDMFTGKRMAVLRGIGQYVDNLSFSRNGGLLGIGADTGGLQIWDLRHKRRIASIKLGGSDVSAPSFSPNGKLVAAGTYRSGTVWLIDISKERILDHWKVSDLGCGSAAFSPDGRYLITPSTGGLITWPYDYGGTIRVFKVNAD